MEEIFTLIKKLNDRILWGTPMVALLLGIGIYLTVKTRALVFRKFSIALRYTLGSLLQKSPQAARKGAITPFQALCTALAATVGTGNIIGVAIAIATGGPGAVFWLWVSALIGMVIKYSEVTLAVAYRRTNEAGQKVGGPMYYIRDGCKSKVLASAFALLAVFAAWGTGAGVQANALSGSMLGSFHVPTWICGGILALLTALVVLGGIGRIANVAELLVPFMSGLYMISAAVVLIHNWQALPGAFSMIFRSAFQGAAPSGGFLGASVQYACRVGMARGVFTHEAGMGSAPIAHACADTDHPARQGLWGAFEVFFDSIVMCTVTALVILTSDLWRDGTLVENAQLLSATAFENAFYGGGYVVSIGVVLFSFATIIAWYYYGQKCAEYLFPGSQIMQRVYQLGYIAMVFWGSVMKLDKIWELADLLNGLMSIPNLIALVILCPVVARLTRDFYSEPHTIRATLLQ